MSSRILRIPEGKNINMDNFVAKATVYKGKKSIRSRKKILNFFTDGFLKGRKDGPIISSAIYAGENFFGEKHIVEFSKMIFFEVETTSQGFLHIFERISNLASIFYIQFSNDLARDPYKVRIVLFANRIIQKKEHETVMRCLDSLLHHGRYVKNLKYTYDGTRKYTFPAADSLGRATSNIFRNGACVDIDKILAIHSKRPN